MMYTQYKKQLKTKLNFTIRDIYNKFSRYGLNSSKGWSESFYIFVSVGHEKISTGHDGISTGLDTTAKKMKLGKYTGGGQQKEIAPPNQVCICHPKQVNFIEMKRVIEIEIK